MCLYAVNHFHQLQYDDEWQDQDFQVLLILGRESVTSGRFSLSELVFAQSEQAAA